jgi:hypothetical protein
MGKSTQTETVTVAKAEIVVPQVATLEGELQTVADLATERAEKLNAFHDAIAAADQIKQSFDEARERAIKAGEAFVAMFPSLADAVEFFKAGLPADMSADTKRQRCLRFRQKLKTGSTQTPSAKAAKKRAAQAARKALAQVKSGGVLPSAVAQANEAAGDDDGEDDESGAAFDLAALQRSVLNDIGNAAHGLSLLRDIQGPLAALPALQFIVALCKFSDTLKNPKAGVNYKDNLSVLRVKHGR